MEKCNFVSIVISFVRNISLLTYLQGDTVKWDDFEQNLSMQNADLKQPDREKT